MLEPRGVAVVVEATHHCVATRGVGRPGGLMVTSRLTGVFQDEPSVEREVLALIGRPGGELRHEGRG